MATQIGIGKSILQDAFEAGKQAAQEALKTLKGKKPDIIFVFATIGYEQQDVLDGILEIVPNSKISGCTSTGVILQNYVNEEMYALSLMMIQSDEIKFENFMVKGLKEDSYGCGVKLAQAINAKNISKAKMLLLFPDGLSVNTTPLFEGIESTLKQKLPLSGGLSGDNLKFLKSFQFHNNQVVTNALSAVVMSGKFDYKTIVTHGSLPTNFQNTITKADKNIIYELDGKPVLEVIEKYFGEPITKENQISAIFVLAFGEKIQDEEVAKEYDSPYILKAMLQIDLDRKVVILPGEVAQGQKIQFLRRDTELILKNAVKSAQKTKAELQNKPIKFVLHIDCAGRGQSIYEDKAIEEPRSFQKILGTDIPWLGFYSFGEISPIKNLNYFHNFTSVLLIVH